MSHLTIAGKIPARRGRPDCRNGCIGPVVYDHKYTAWMRELEVQIHGAPLALSYGHCLHCGTHNVMPPLGRAA